MIDRYLKLFEDQPANHPAVQIVRLFAVQPQATENLPKNTKTKMTTVNEILKSCPEPGTL